MNTGYLVKAMILAIASIVIGYILYKEPFSYKKAIGVAIWIFGLILINQWQRERWIEPQYSV